MKKSIASSIQPTLAAKSAFHCARVIVRYQDTTGTEVICSMVLHWATVPRAQNSQVQGKSFRQVRATFGRSGRFYRLRGLNARERGPIPRWQSVQSVGSRPAVKAFRGGLSFPAYPPVPRGFRL